LGSVRRLRTRERALVARWSVMQNTVRVRKRVRCVLRVGYAWSEGYGWYERRLLKVALCLHEGAPGVFFKRA